MTRFAGIAAAFAALVALAAPMQSGASAAPTATTGSASSVTATAAVLGGTVNPNGSPTTYVLEYGATTAYGSQTAPVSAGAGSAAVAVSATVGGLSPDATYHFRLVASSSGGTTAGADAAFTTAKAPPIVATGIATLATSTSAVLNGTVNPNGKATSYQFQYGRTTAYGLQSAATSVGSGTAPVAVRATVSGLTPSANYHYRVIATNPDGTVTGADAAFATGRVAPTASTAAATVVTPGSAVLAGSVNPQGTATSYAFQYGTSAGYGSQTSYVAAGSGTGSTHVTALVSGLAAGTAYHYRLVATSSAGTGVGADASLMTTAGVLAQGAVLPVVSGAGAVNVSTAGAQLNGAVNPAAASTTWDFEYGLTSGYGLQTRPQTTSSLGARPINAKLAGLEPGTTFHFRLVAQSGTTLYVGPDAVFQTKPVARLRPAGLTLIAASSLHRRSATVAVSGRVALPPTLTAASACNGVVEIQIERGPDTISLRSAPLRPDCSYSGQLTFGPGRLRGVRRLGISVHFTGNAMLLPTGARRASVRA